MKHELLSPTVLIASMEITPEGTVIYTDRKALAKFEYAGELFFITSDLEKDGYVATHERTGRRVLKGEPRKTVKEAVEMGHEVLDDNCDKFHNIHRFTGVPKFNLSLNLALLNLL